MAEVHTWDVTASNNNAAPPDGAPENMNYSQVNNSMREMYAAIKRWHDDLGGALAAGGTANAITVTPNVTYGSLFAGMRIAFTAGLTNTGATTLNVGGLGASELRGYDDVALTGGEIVAGRIYDVVYTGTRWNFVNPELALNFVPATGGTFTGAVVFDDDVTIDTNLFVADASANTIDMTADVTVTGATVLAGDVTIDTNLFVADASANTIDMTADVTVTGATVLAGDLTVDSGVLQVAASTNRVGVNIAPTLGVVQIDAPSGTLPALYVKGNEGGGGAGIEIGTHSAGTETDLAFNGNAVMASAVSLTIGHEGAVGGTNYVRFVRNLTDRLTGTAGLAETLRINGDGNVGVRTASPSGPLHVNIDDYDVSNTSGEPALILSWNDYGLNQAAGNGPRIDFHGPDSATSTTATKKVASIWARKASNGDDLTLYQLKFEVNDGSSAVDAMTIDENGNVGILTASPSDVLEVNGDVTAVDFNATSDARLKENIETLPHGLAAVLAMQPRAYDWIEQKEHDIGFVAQELESIVPEVVSQKGEYKRVSYGKLVAVLAKAIQELTEEVRNGGS